MAPPTSARRAERMRDGVGQRRGERLWMQQSTCLPGAGAKVAVRLLPLTRTRTTPPARAAARPEGSTLPLAATEHTPRSPHETTVAQAGSQHLRGLLRRNATRSIVIVRPQICDSPEDPGSWSRCRHIHSSKHNMANVGARVPWQQRPTTATRPTVGFGRQVGAVRQPTVSANWRPPGAASPTAVVARSTTRSGARRGLSRRQQICGASISASPAAN